MVAPLQAITDPKQIRVAQQRLQELLAAELPELLAPRSLSGIAKVPARSDGLFQFWACNVDQGSFFWNGFGLGDCRTGRVFEDVAANVSFKGGGRHAARYARADDGSIHLVHLGRIKGGRIPSKYLSGELIDRGTKRKILRIAEVDKGIADHLRNFVRLIRDIKNVGGGRAHKLVNLGDGRTVSYVLPQTIVRRRADHRDVVTALRQTFSKLTPGERLADDIGIADDLWCDMYIPIDKDGRNASVVFEAKSQAQPYDIYTAVGQLMLHGHDRSARLHVAVLPSSTETKRVEALRALTPTIVTLFWKRDPRGRICFLPTKRVHEIRGEARKR